MNLAVIKKQILESKKVLENERDILRELFEEMESVMDNYNHTIENLECSRVELEQAIETMSEIV